MAEEKKDTGFKVTDRRLFTEDGELRKEPVEETPRAPAETSVSAGNVVPEASAADLPAPPTASEQQAQHEAYKASSRDLDARVEQSGHSAKDLEVNFKGFMASLYMTAMLQLGLMREQGAEPQIDLIGARQTIDTLGMLSEKTKGNLTIEEQHFLQNSLYELRMAYVEVTNALSRPPQARGPSSGPKG